MKARTLKGFRDYGPEEMLVRDEMFARVAGVFRSFGYAPLHTPALEYAEILLGKYGDEGEKLLYKFEDHGGRMVALRYDLTVPLARYVGMNQNLRFPFRRFQIAPVWRAERPQKGRFREFYQCDVDLVGVDSAQADAECILVDHSVLKTLGLTGYRIQINHREYLDGLLEQLQIPADKVVPVMRILDKVDKVSVEDLGEWLKEEGLGDEQTKTLLGLSAVEGDNAKRFAAGRKLAGGNEKAEAALQRLEQVVALVDATMPDVPVFFTPSIARGLDYYTGIVYETFLPSQYGVGSVMSGGRYDNLLGSFSKQQIPAVGISLGIDRLLSAMTAAGETEEAVASDVLVCTVKGAEEGAAMVAGKLREGLAGAAVELFPKAAKLKKQMDYANKKNAAVVVIPGPEELAAGSAAVRSMKSGEQATVPLDDVVETTRRMLGG